MITNFKIFENENSVIYRLGTENDLVDIKKITNKLRNELGFVMNVALKDAILHDELFVAELDNKVIGFIHYHKRKDGWNTIHELGVHPDYQKLGIGKKLFNMIPKPVRLKTTVDNLTANTFYKYQGMENIGTEKGKKRELNIWTKESVNEKTIVFPSHEDKYLFNNQKVNQDIKNKLPYKEGDIVYIKYKDDNPHGFYEGPAEILFIRKFSKNKIGYGVVEFGGNPDYYFEVDESDIVKKLEQHEIAAIKYNL